MPPRIRIRRAMVPPRPTPTALWSTASCLLACLLLACLAPTFGGLEARILRYSGSVYRGIDEATVRSEGVNITFHLTIPVNTTELHDLLRNSTELRQMFSRYAFAVTSNGTILSEETMWSQQLDQLINGSTVSAQRGGRLLVVSFRAAPAWRSGGNAEVVVPCFPRWLLDTTLFPAIEAPYQNSATRAERLFRETEKRPNSGPTEVRWGASPMDRLWAASWHARLSEAAEECIPGDPFAVFPRGTVRATRSSHSRRPAAGASLEMAVMGDWLTQLPAGDTNFKVMEGSTCRNTREASIRWRLWTAHNSSLRLTPVRGGLMCLCYLPFPEMLPELLIDISGKLTVSGPEGVSTEPSQIRADMEYVATIFGTEMTDLDTFVVTTQLCTEYELQRKDVQIMSMSSPSRALFVGMFPRRGIYHLCFRHEHGDTFVRVATFLVEKGGDIMISGAAERVLVDQDMMLDQDIFVEELGLLSSGSLSLNRHTLNTSVFMWSGGSVTGQGSIRCFRLGKITTQGLASHQLTVPVHNYGTMMLTIRRLELLEDGALHNHGNMTIVVDPLDEDGDGSITALTPMNLIHNHANATLTISTRSLSRQVALRVRVVSEGRVTLSNALTVSELIMTRRASLVLLRGSNVTVSGSRIRGATSLESNATLLIADKSTLSSCSIGGSGTVWVSGKSIQVDSVTFVGNTVVVIDGTSRYSGDVQTVGIYGTTRFTENTVAFVRRARFVTSTGLAKLLFDGALLTDIDSIDFASNTIVQLSYIAIFYGSGATEIAPLERHILPATVLVPPNATLIIFDHNSHGNMTATQICARPFSVADFLTISGRLVLRGCAVFPLGGGLSGSVERLEKPEDWKWLFDTVCYEGVLKSVPEWCVTRVPLEVSHSGLIVGGEVYSREETVVDIDVFAIHGAAVTLSKTVSFRVAEVFHVDGASKVSFLRGAEITSPRVTVDGKVDFHSANSTVVKGNLYLSPGADITLRVSRDQMLFAGTSGRSCQDYLNVVGLVASGEPEQFSCVSPRGGPYAPLSLPADDGGRETGDGRTLEKMDGVDLVASTTSAASEQRSTAYPNLAGLYCPPNIMEEEEQLRQVLRIFGWDDGTAEEEFFVPWWEKLLASVVLISGVAVMSLAHMRLIGLTWTDYVSYMTRKPPLRLTLLWPEFRAQSLNFVLFASITSEILQSTIPLFNPNLPLPKGIITAMSHRSANFLMSRNRAKYVGSIQQTCYFVCANGALGMLMVLAHRRWVAQAPASLRVLSFFSCYFRFQVLMTFVAVQFTATVLTKIMEVLSCATLMRGQPSCAALRPLLPISLVALFLMGLAFPVGITMVQLRVINFDGRFKVLVLHLRHMVVFVEVAFWKILYNDPEILFLVSFLSQVVRCAAMYYCNPSGYENINRFTLNMALTPLILFTCTGIHLARVRFGTMHACNDGENIFMVGLGLIALSIVVNVVTCIIYSRPPKVSCGDLVVDEARLVVARLREEIQMLQLDLIGCADRAAREDNANRRAKLRIEYLEMMERYQRHKDRFLHPYVFGPFLDSYSILRMGKKDPPELPSLPPAPLTAKAPTPTDAAVRQARGRLESLDALSRKPNDYATLMSSSSVVSPYGLGKRRLSSTQFDVRSQDSTDREMLTQEEMETFSCGPALGRGSYGTVHLGILSTGKLVAVKYINILDQPQEILEAIQAEVTMLGDLCHPNVIRYYGCSTNDEYMMVFMEFAVAGSLTSLARKFNALSEPVMRLYTLQIVRGLKYLHDRGVVHRDIKGENILIDGSGVAKLADFGCSKELAGLANRSHAGCGTLVGSPFWMAPEVIRSEAYGTKADIWSVGCTVVEMLNGGRPPWQIEFENVYSAMFYVGSTNTIPSIPEGTSDLCRDFLARCFERDVTKRATAEELLEHPWMVEAAMAGMEHESTAVFSKLLAESDSISDSSSQPSPYANSGGSGMPKGPPRPRRRKTMVDPGLRASNNTSATMQNSVPGNTFSDFAISLRLTNLESTSPLAAAAGQLAHEATRCTGALGPVADGQDVGKIVAAPGDDAVSPDEGAAVLE